MVIGLQGVGVYVATSKLQSFAYIRTGRFSRFVSSASSECLAGSQLAEPTTLRATNPTAQRIKPTKHGATVALPMLREGADLRKKRDGHPPLADA